MSDTADSTIIKVRDLWKVFGTHFSADCNPQTRNEKLRARLDRGVVALQEASFEVKRGEIFMIMGLSGSGKSTLLRCLTGLYPPSWGSIEIGALDLGKVSREQLVDLRRHKISMVFQHFAILPHLNVIDNVAFPLRVRGVAREERLAAARAAIELVGLDGKENRFPSQLSGGQQQRVGIARSLITEPEIWFLDEPFSALDPLIRKEMQNEFQRLQSQLHKTIVFVTHDLEEAVRLGDRIAVMSEGRILQIGTPEEIILQPKDAFVDKFVSGIAKSRVIRVQSLAKSADGHSLEGEPVQGAARIADVAERVILSTGPLPVVDKSGKLIGQISAKEVAPWLS